MAEQFFEKPSLEEFDNQGNFLNSATPVDPRSAEEFQSEWLQHKGDKETIKSKDSSNWKNIVDSHPSQVPESFLTEKEKDEQFGAHPLRKHDLDRLN